MIRSRCASRPASSPSTSISRIACGVERKAEMEGLFDRDQNPLIHHFQGRRNDAGADNLADGVGGVVDRFEHAQHGSHALRIARQPDPNLGDDGQRSFAAHQRADQVEPGRILAGPPNSTIEPSAMTTSTPSV